MPNCPFCPSNGKVQILRQNSLAYLVATLDENGVVIPHHYLVIPKSHVESVMHLADEWHAYMIQLVRHIPEYQHGVPFNISYNEGKAAGQRVAHAHAWIIFRQGEEGSKTENLGLAALIKQGRPNKN